MEYIDILTETGKRTGVVLTRDEVHQKGMWHQCVIVAVVDGNRVLMQQRSKTRKKYPNLWDISVAAHIVSGENSLDGAIRELKEEIGLSAKKEELQFISSFKNTHRYEKELIENVFYDLFLLKKSIDLKDLNFVDGEVQNIKWMDKQMIKNLQAKNMLHPRTEWIDILNSYVK